MQHTDFKDLVEALQENGEACSLTSGRSMRPMLRQHKDIVTVKPVARKLKKGDVVVYPSNDGRSVLHRIVAIKKGNYIIRGDNNYFTEYGITDNDIKGILTCFYRDGKYINCETSHGYKLYSLYICHSYYLRYIFYKLFWRGFLLRVLVKLKHFLFPKKVGK